ncbi:FecR domain-containing protein [Burkholderia alba]|uniref:FecR domain-containing protein n=1 Tax=Burkholderia alba TaxID=2683677 RepID=UPI002B058455|nr:FecR domain-containing protein [Burkholderia alba]
MSGRPDPSGSPAPIADEVVERAVGWLARLWSGDATDDDAARCAAWRAEHPDHERAWRRLGGIEAKLQSVPAAAAQHTLLQARPKRGGTAAPARRRAMRALGLAITVGGACYGVRSTRAWQTAAADYATAVGEVKEIVLADGTRIWLDTSSALDVRFSGGERRVALRRGAIYVATAHDALGRPFRVETRQGTVRALGTRFAVRDAGAGARVDVLEGAVEIRAARVPTQLRRLAAGEAVRFTADTIGAPGSADEQASAWTRHLLIAERMPVDAFVATLARYRPGVVRCDPALARASVSGVFSLADTDRALASLQAALPVSVVYRTRYWVTVAPR